MRTKYTLSRNDLRTKQYAKADVCCIDSESVKPDSITITELIIKSLNSEKGEKINENIK